MSLPTFEDLGSMYVTFGDLLVIKFNFENFYHTFRWGFKLWVFEEGVFTVEIWITGYNHHLSKSIGESNKNHVFLKLSLIQIDRGDRSCQRIDLVMVRSITQPVI